MTYIKKVDPDNYINSFDIMYLTSSETSKIALILANGPSAKLVDFSHPALTHITTVGMNSAFRYWKKIDFRPSHYICMDIEVSHTISADIVELIKENRIKKFFLRDELKNAYPEIAYDERILWYSHAVTEYPVFNSSLVTTGSWAIRWMLHEGMDVLATIGIDGIQTEVLKEAKRLEGIQLRLEKTPEFNPNYFFANYQQAGDIYNVPNSPDYQAKTGQLLHIDALRQTAKTQQRYFPASKIFDLSPSSDHGIFPKKSFSDWEKRISLTLITSFHTGFDPEALINNIAIAVQNSSNPLVVKVHLLIEGGRSRLDEILPSRLSECLLLREAEGRIRIVEIQQRPSYWVLLDYANKHCRSNSCIIANSDILLLPFEAERIVLSRVFDSSALLAITRWNRTVSGVFPQGPQSSPPWQQIESSVCKQSDKNYLSFDTYVFEIPIIIPPELNEVLIGSFGCDTAISGIIRAHGHQVSNPCLKIKTIHIDEKQRDYDSARVSNSIRHNVCAFQASVLSRYKSRKPIMQSLVELSQLNRTLAWIGAPNTRDSWHSLYRTIGAVFWSNHETPLQPIFKRLSITKIDLENGDLDTGALLHELDQKFVFLDIELTGFSKPEHIANILQRYEHHVELGKLLQSYPWQSMVHTDFVSADVRAIHFDLLLVAKDLLAVPTPTKPYDEQASCQQFNASGILQSGFDEKTAECYRLIPPYNERYIAFCYTGFIHRQETISAEVSFSINRDSKLRLMMCRHGDSPFESADKTMFLKKGRHSITLEHQFQFVHVGVRIQIGTEKHETVIYGINIQLNSVSSNVEKISEYVEPRLSDCKKFIVLDPDGKNMRGHFIAYCDQLLGACNAAGVQASVWCRNDIDKDLLISRNQFFTTFDTHSWAIATNEDKFLIEMEKGLKKNLCAGGNTLIYLYTGSFHHARVFLSLANKFPNLQFNCNLFWEMIRDISSPEYEVVAKFVLEGINVNRQVALSVPTKLLQKEINDRFGVTLPLAPHPSTAVSDQLFRKIYSGCSRVIFEPKSEYFNVLFLRAATQSKGYEIGLEAAKILSNDHSIICWARDENKGVLPDDVRVIPQNLTDKEFNELLQSADAVVLPYLSDGFKKRTSGIVIDAMYFGVPSVVCKGTWLAELVQNYGIGIVSESSAESIVKSVLKLRSEYKQLHLNTFNASKRYFSVNSWNSLVRFLFRSVSDATTTSTLLQNDLSLKKANQLFREGAFEEAYYIYKRLYEMRPLKMYRDNLELCERRLTKA